MVRLDRSIFEDYFYNLFELFLIALHLGFCALLYRYHDLRWVAVERGVYGRGSGKRKARPAMKRERAMRLFEATYHRLDRIFDACCSGGVDRLADGEREDRYCL